MTGRKLIDGVTAEDRAADWYVIRTATRQEFKAERHLIEAGFVVYLPRMKRTRVLRRSGLEDFEAPLFEGYLFAGLSAGRAMRELRVEGVSGVVQFGFERPRPVPLGRILHIARQEAVGAFDKTKRKAVAAFKRGELVRIAAGPFAGQFANVLDLTSRQRVRLLVDLFGSRVPMEVDALDLESVAGSVDDVGESVRVSPSNGGARKSAAGTTGRRNTRSQSETADPGQKMRPSEGVCLKADIQEIAADAAP